MSVGHILHDGGVESHAAIERRLVEATSDSDLFATGQDERLAAAYRGRARAVGYRRNGANKRPSKTAKKRATAANKKSP